MLTVSHSSMRDPNILPVHNSNGTHTSGNQARNGEFSLSYFFQQNQWGERYIPEVNRDNFDAVASVDYYRMDLDVDLTAKDTVHVIIGSDSGLLLKFILTQDIGAGSRVVLIEPDELFEAINSEYKEQLSTHFEQSEHNPTISLHAESSWQEEFFDGKDSVWFLAGHVSLFRSRCAINDYPRSYFNLYKDAQAALAERHHHSFVHLNTKTFTNAQMQLVVDNQQTIKLTDEFGKNKTAIVLGGGPSLDKHLDWIIKNRKFLFIVAASRLCEKLNIIALKPDVVVSIDPHPAMYNVSKHGVLWKDVPLIHSYHASAGLVQQWQGPCYYLGHRFPWDICNGRVHTNISSTGPTVSHAALLFASQLGFTQILLSGVDLCIDSQGSTHSQDSPEAALVRLPSYYDAQVKTYSGRLAGTPIYLYRSIESLDILGKNINRYRDVVFNLNNEAAVVDSINCIDTCDVVLSGERPAFDSAVIMGKKNDFSELKIELASAKRQFRAVLKVSKKAKSIVIKLYGSGEITSNTDYQSRLNVLEKRLEKQGGYSLNTIRHYYAPEYAQLRKPRGFANMSNDELKQWGVDYYDLVAVGAKQFINAINNAEKTIHIREAETLKQPDVEKLLSLWATESTPGRVLIFQENLKSSATESELILIDNAIDNYVESVRSVDEYFKKRVINRYQSISKTIESLLFLYHKKSSTDLSSFSKKLMPLAWPYNTIAHFIDGLIAQIDDNELDATIAFQQVVDACAEQLDSGNEDLNNVGRLIEETLSRLTRSFLTLKDHESACTALGTLCEFSPQYIPSYANLLNLLGNSNNALELLELYLGNYPKDWRAARQMSEIHAKRGEIVASSLAMELAEKIRKQHSAIDIKAVA